METKEKDFKVYAWVVTDENTPIYCHWSTGLKMSIIKNGVTIILNSDEIKELAKYLPIRVG